jgi:parallel beta-helix repeat protein
MSYSFRRPILVATMLASAGLYGQNALATTLVVGPTTCQPGKPHYASIQLGVNAAPNGGTVLVCPGTYPEQVAITKPLILKGVTDGTSNAAIITVPTGGLTVNAVAPTYYGAVSGQLVVQNTSGVTVSNLTIDGTGSGCVPYANRESGIVAYNVGNTVISGMSVRNEITGCQLGEGIISDTSSITISSNQIHDVDRTGITITGGVATVEFNNVQNAPYYGVSIYLADKSVLTGNTVSGLNNLCCYVGAAIYVWTSSHAIVSKNTVLASPSLYNYGIWVYQNASANTVSGNIVSDVGYGFVMDGSGSNVVQSNKFSELQGDGIYEDTSLGGNNITKNTVNEAAFGIFTDSSVGGDTLVPNTFFNTLTTIDPSPAVTPNPQTP